MSAFGVLLQLSLYRVRVLVLIMGLLLGLFPILLTLAAREIHESNLFGQISMLVPDFIRQLLGPSFLSLMTFTGFVCLGFFHLAVMGALIGLVIALATELNVEMETGFMDLILSRSLGRYWIVVRSIVVLTLVATFLLTMILLGIWTGLNWLAPPGVPWPSTRLILSLAINLWTLLVCWGGITLAFASMSRRRGVVGSTAGILALTTYLLDYLARAWRPARAVGWASPFRYYNPLEMVRGEPLAIENLVVLLSTAAAGFAVAFICFSRRDL
jgi:ABC-2 type transport system permease protein